MPHTFKSHSSILNPSVFATALVFFIVLFGSGLVTVWAEEEQAIYKLQVNGLSCPFCNFGIEKGFMSVNGVEKVRIDNLDATKSPTGCRGCRIYPGGF